MPFLDDLLSKVGVIAGPTQRPGPAGSVVETNESLLPGDAQVNLLKGGNFIETGNAVSPTILAHELGHVKQNQGKSSLRNVLEGLAGFGDAASRGAFVHDPEKGGDRERMALGDGVKLLQGSDDFASKDLLNQLPVERYQQQGALSARPQGGPFSNFLSELFSNPGSRSGVSPKGTQTFTGIRG